MLGTHPGERRERQAREQVERDLEGLTRNLGRIGEAAAAVHHAPPGIRRQQRLEALLAVCDAETLDHLTAALKPEREKAA